MKKWTKQIALALTLVLGTGLLAGCGSEEKIGYVDVTKIQMESKKAQQIEAQVAEKNMAVMQRLQKDQQEKSKEEFAQEVQQSQREMQLFQQAMVRSFRDAMNSTAADVAREKELSLVLNSQAIPAGGIDITAEVLAKMDEAVAKETATKEKAAKKLKDAAAEEKANKEAK